MYIMYKYKYKRSVCSGQRNVLAIDQIRSFPTQFFPARSMRSTVRASYVLRTYYDILPGIQSTQHINKHLQSLQDPTAADLWAIPSVNLAQWAGKSLSPNVFRISVGTIDPKHPPRYQPLASREQNSIYSSANIRQNMWSTEPQSFKYGQLCRKSDPGKTTP